MGCFLEPVEMPSSVHKAVWALMCWGRYPLVGVAPRLPVLPLSSLILEKAHCARWDMGIEVQKPGNWIRHSWVQLGIFQSWIMVSI